MPRTKIEWVLNPDGTPGYTLNPITGCLNHDEGMCKGGGFPCYAYGLAKGRLMNRYLANTNIAPIANDYPTEQTTAEAIRLIHLREAVLQDPFYPRLWPERLAELDGRNKYIHDINRSPKQRGIFVCDMSDLFGIGIPKEWTNDVLNRIDLNDGYDRFYLLTKQPQNLVKFSPFPDNCWVGVTATDVNAVFRAMKELSNVKAKVKYLSLEPLLGRCYGPDWQNVDGVIIGAQTKPYKPPKIEWVEEIIRGCDRAGVPVFLKNNLHWPRLSCDGAIPFYKKDIGTMVLRQEMPKLK